LKVRDLIVKKKNSYIRFNGFSRATNSGSYKTTSK